jgi:hypothetical protein
MKNQNRKQIAAKMAAQTGTHIGSIAMWTLSGCQITAGALHTLYEQVGLAWDEWGPPDIDGDAAFTKALREAKRDAEGYRFVTLFNGADKKVVGIVREDVNKAAEDVDYKKDWSSEACKVTHDRINLSVRLSNPAHPVGQRIKALYTECTETYMVTDFIRLLSRNVTQRMDGVSLRSRGGAYFVPATRYADLLKHQALLEAVSAEAEMFVGNLKDDAQTVRSVGRDARRDLLAEIAAFEAELAEWREKLPRRDTLGRRLAEYKSLSMKAETYAQMLSIKADDILDSLRAASTEAGRLLGIAEDEHGKKKAARAARPVRVVRKVEAPVAPTKKAAVVKRA